MKRFTLALVFAVVAVSGTTASMSVSAQEILLEGPLAGAPAVRKLVQYRKMRFSVGPQFTYTLLNEYSHNYLVGLELGFNFFDWFGLGLVGSYGFNSPTKLTRHIADSEDIAGNDTTPTESNWPSYTGSNNFEDQVAELKGMYFLQLNFVLFRGKASFFEKAFVATDIVFFIGGGLVLFEERADCDSTVPGGGCGTLANPNVERETRIGPTVGTYGFNFDFFINDWAAINVQLRFSPFWWNAGGTDESGQAAETWVVRRDNGDDNQPNTEDDQPIWVSTASGGEGDYPDGKIDKEDRQFNPNMSIGLGAVFFFPTAPSISK